MPRRSSDETILRRSASETVQPQGTIGFLDNGGEMGKIMRGFDWPGTVLGPAEQWPACLQTAVSLMLNAVHPVFIWWGPEHLSNLYNDAYREILGDRHPASMAQPAKTIWPEIWPDVAPLVQSVFAEGKPVHRQDMRLKIKRGGRLREAYFSFSYSPILGHDSKVEGLFCSVKETTAEIVSQQKLEEYEAKLKESERRFRALADTAPMFIAMADETGNAVYFNKTWLDFTGKELDQMTGLQWLSVLHPDDAPRFERDFKAAFANQQTISQEYRFRRADGEYRWMLAVGAPRYTPDGRFSGYYGTYTDFHDLKQAQLAVQENEERFRTLANNIAQLAWMADETGARIWFNQRWYDYTGLTEAEGEGWGWRQIQHPKHRERVVESYRQSISRGEVWEDTFPLRGKDGRYRWFLTRAIPIKDSRTGKISRYFGTNTDITELRTANQRRVELEHITSALKKQQAQLLSLNQAKDEFISLASHQLRTPATGVKQYLGMLLGDFAGTLTDDQRVLAQHAYDSNDRQLNVVSDLLSVAQADAGKISLQRKPIDLVEFIYNIIDEQASKFVERQQTVSFRHASGPCVAKLDPTRMRMVLENLVDNASKYTTPGKKITISLTQPMPGSVRIAVKDQGVGIDDANLETIFDKFVRVNNPLSDIVGGSGLGLYLVKKVVELHDGHIKVSSTPGKGSTFIVTIPLA